MTPSLTSWRADRGDHGTWTVWLDRPGSSQNSLDSGSVRELGAVLTEIERDAGAARLVLRSAKPKGFCAGADLKELGGLSSPGAVLDFARLGIEVLGRIAALPVPSIAVIHGVCLGGGLELALACRFRVGLLGEYEPLLGTPEVKLALVPGWGGISRLVRLIGLEPALPLLLQGDPVRGAEALRLGLLDRLVAPDALDAALAGLTEPPRRRTWPPDDATWQAVIPRARAAIAPNTPATRACRLILDILEVDRAEGLDAGLEAAAQGLAETLLSAEAKAAIGAFLARRGPRA